MVTLDPDGGQAEVGADPDHRLFQRPHVRDHVQRLGQPVVPVPEGEGGGLLVDLGKPVSVGDVRREE